MSFLEEAREKLRKELPSIKGQKEGAIKHAVMDALLNFAEQDGEFAQAIAQGGSFADCMAAVCKGIGTNISDLDAYGRAAAFYFPGCKVRFEMHIDLIGEAAGETDCHANAAAETPSVTSVSTGASSPKGGAKGKEGAKAANDAADAEREKHEKAEKELKEQIDALAGQVKTESGNREKLEKQLREAEEKAAAAQKDGAEAEELRGQIEGLKKQLALAAPEVAEFKAAFERVQREFSAMLETLDRIQDGETRGKLRAACVAVLDGFMGRVKE